MFIAKVFSFLFVCLLAACENSVSQTGNANQTQTKEKTQLSLKMERSGCYGRCPIYDLTIQPDGKVTFEGKFYTETKGKAEDKLSEEQLKRLINEIEKSNFFSFDDIYNYDSKNCPSIATDMATVTLFIELNGNKKTITHYWGCWINQFPKENNPANVKVEKDYSPQVFPPQLYNLENKIDEIIETKRWVGERK